MEAMRKRRGNFHFLLVFLLLQVVIQPFLDPGPLRSVIMTVLVAGVLVSSVFALIRRRRVLVFGSVLAAVTFSVTLLARLHPHAALSTAGMCLLSAFLVFTAAVLIASVFGPGTVTAQRLSGAACVYLILGFLWATLFGILEARAPGSLRMSEEDAFRVQEALRSGNASDVLTYYSFVTLTTLGYGDMVPVSRTARMLAWLEALLGQLYLTILVAQLVGMHLSRARNGRPPE